MKGFLFKTSTDSPVSGTKEIAVLVDPEGQCIKRMSPHIVVDAIMAKTQTSTHIGEAPFVIGVGSVFAAPVNAHVVIETNRGHNLGRVRRNGSVKPITGTPGATMGYTTERVHKSPHAGRVRHVKHIGDSVKEGDAILYLKKTPVTARIDDVPGVSSGRTEHCYTISDKARAILVGVSWKPSCLISTTGETKGTTSLS
jgi:xanthine dehydrogenase accessory factor